MHPIGRLSPPIAQQSSPTLLCPLYFSAKAPWLFLPPRARAFNHRCDLPSRFARCAHFCTLRRTNTRSAFITRHTHTRVQTLNVHCTYYILSILRGGSCASYPGKNSSLTFFFFVLFLSLRKLQLFVLRALTLQNREFSLIGRGNCMNCFVKKEKEKRKKNVLVEQNFMQQLTRRFF